MTTKGTQLQLVTCTSASHLYRYFINYIGEVCLVFESESVVEFKHSKVLVPVKYIKQSAKRVVWQ